MDNYDDLKEEYKKTLRLKQIAQQRAKDAQKISTTIDQALKNMKYQHIVDSMDTMIGRIREKTETITQRLDMLLSDEKNYRHQTQHPSFTTETIKNLSTYHTSPTVTKSHSSKYHQELKTNIKNINTYIDLIEADIDKLAHNINTIKTIGSIPKKDNKD